MQASSLSPSLAIEWSVAGETRIRSPSLTCWVSPATDIVPPPRTTT
jgi:hypothetical protein